MTHASPRCSPGGQQGFRVKCAQRTTGIMAVVLFLFLSPTLNWAQTASPDKPSGAAPEKSTQQSGSAGDSATQPDGTTQGSPQAAVAVPAPDIIPVEPKPDSSEGKQSKRMFWIIPNFAAVSAGVELPPLTTREKYALALQDSVDY